MIDFGFELSIFALLPAPSSSRDTPPALQCSSAAFRKFLNLALASGHTSLIIASGVLSPTLTYLPCSMALPVKYRLLSDDLITTPNISTNFARLANILAIYVSILVFVKQAFDALDLVVELYIEPLSNN